MDDVLVLVGGIIPDEDVRRSARGMGVQGVFGPGTSTQDIIEFIRDDVGEQVA